MRQKRASIKNWTRRHADRARERRFWQSRRGITLIGNMTRAANRLLSHNALTLERATMSSEDQRSTLLNRRIGNTINHIPLGGLRPAGSMGWLNNLRK